MIRYENLVGDRSWRSRRVRVAMRKLPPGGTINGPTPSPPGSRCVAAATPVLKAFLTLTRSTLITCKINELLHCPLAKDTGAFWRRRHATSLIGEVITNLNAVLATVDAKKRNFGASVDQLRQLVSGLAKNRDLIAGATLASTTTDTNQRRTRGVAKAFWWKNGAGPSFDTWCPKPSPRLSKAGEDYFCACPRRSYGTFFNTTSPGDDQDQRTGRAATSAADWRGQPIQGVRWEPSSKHERDLAPDRHLPVRRSASS